MRNMIPNRKEKGFTLIELVMVIVILAILAAFALPRFADFGTEARTASINGAAGGVRSAASIAHSRWVADGDNSSVEVTLDGVEVAMDATNGFPTLAGIKAAAQLSDDYDVTVDGTDATLVNISLIGANSALYTDCDFGYSIATGQVSSVEDGCETLGTAP